MRQCEIRRQLVLLSARLREYEADTKSDNRFSFYKHGSGSPARPASFFRLFLSNG